MRWPGPIKASPPLPPLFAVFDSKGLIYTHIQPRGANINANYIVKALGNFMKQLKKKRHMTAEQKRFFHRDNALVHAEAVTQTLIATAANQHLNHPSYSPDLAPVYFSWFRRVKKELVGLSLDGDSLKTAWEGVTRVIAAGEVPPGLWW